MNGNWTAIAAIEMETLNGGAGNNIPPGLLSLDGTNPGQPRAYAAGGIAGYGFAIENDQPQFFFRELKNGKTLTWGS